MRYKIKQKKEGDGNSISAQQSMQKHKNLIHFPCKEHEEAILLPIVCPVCGEVLGYLHPVNKQYVIDGNYCRTCGMPVRGNDYMEE